MKQEKIMSGEVLVVAKGVIELEMEYGKPDNVIVEFNNDKHRHHHPCSPNHDKLNWNIEKRQHGFVLIIEWEVSVARPIVWAVSFV